MRAVREIQPPPIEALRTTPAALKKVHGLTRHRGKIAAVEPESGDFFLGQSLIEALDGGREKYPAGRLLFRSHRASDDPRTSRWPPPGFPVRVTGRIRVAAALNADFAGYDRFTLATGEEVELTVYGVTVRVGRRIVRTWFTIGEALIGMEFLRQACQRLEADFDSDTIEMLSR